MVSSLLQMDTNEVDKKHQVHWVHGHLCSIHLQTSLLDGTAPIFTLIIYNVIEATAPNSFLPVISMGCIANGLIVLKLFIKKVYRNWVSDIYETIFLLNLAILAYGTLYAQLAGSKDAVTTLGNVLNENLIPTQQTEQR